MTSLRRWTAVRSTSRARTQSAERAGRVDPGAMPIGKLEIDPVAPGGFPRTNLYGPGNGRRVEERLPGPFVDAPRAGATQPQSAIRVEAIVPVAPNDQQLVGLQEFEQLHPKTIFQDSSFRHESPRPRILVARPVRAEGEGVAVSVEVARGGPRESPVVRECRAARDSGSRGTVTQRPKRRGPPEGTGSIPVGGRSGRQTCWCDPVDSKGLGSIQDQFSSRKKNAGERYAA